MAEEVWNPTHSSTIHEVRYDPEAYLLTVQFENRSVYEYYNVPGHVFEDWKYAPSAGRYHRQQILGGHYRCKKIKG